MNKISSTLLAAALVLAGSLSAHDISLVWSPSADPTIIGQKIVYGQVGQPQTNVVNVSQTNYFVTVSNLVSSPSIAYRFSSIGTNAAGQESIPTLDLVSGIYPHSVRNPRFIGRTANGFTVMWQPSDEADAVNYKVTYGTLTPFTVNTVTVPVTATSVTIMNNVVAGADHYFDFTVINAAGVESLPRQQLRDKLLPAGPSSLRVQLLVE